MASINPDPGSNGATAMQAPPVDRSPGSIVAVNNEGNGDEDEEMKSEAIEMEVKMEPGSEGDGSSETPERSSINIIFTDWVPANHGPEPNPNDHLVDTSFIPTFGGNRPRYFQAQGGHRKIRPGLGLNLEEIRPKPKLKKRKPSFIDSYNFAKRTKITPERPACAILHEIDPNLEYVYQEVTIEGSKSLPTFTCTVMYPRNDEGNPYTGEGRSKKLAKNDAAQKVLQALGCFSTANYAEVPTNYAEDSEDTSSYPSVEAPSTLHKISLSEIRDTSLRRVEQFGMDFTSDDIVNETFSSSMPLPPLMLSQPMVDGSILKRLRNIPNFEENITLALNTIAFPNAVEYKDLGEEGPAHDKIFTLELMFNTQTYIGKGGSKKKAKADAAKQAVISLLGLDCYLTLANSSFKQMPLSNVNSLAGSTCPKKSKRKKSPKKPSASVEPLNVTLKEDSMDMEDEDDDDAWGEYDLNFSDFISNSVQGKYKELMGTDPNYSSYKVLAGVVMTTGSPMMYNSKVLSVTTGTKCVEGDCMSDEGLSVNDCHAEILATRCVRDFLYSQIELFENDKASSVPEHEREGCILEANAHPGSPYKYKLKCDVKFHLYISTSPCGDARIFSPKGLELEEGQSTPPSDLEDTHPNKLNRGVLRSKIEAGEGTIPSANLYSGPQTWDSIVSGNALYTMSCSDKVCRWSVLGMQGALLYNLLGSVYYSSITLGSLHHPVHFKRAVYGRIESLNSRLEIPFNVYKPKLMMVSREEKRVVKKSPNHAVCWSMNWSTPEILAANKGRCEPGGVASRLTKRLLFTRFLKLYKNENGRRENYADLSYHEAKQEAADYQKAKNEFVNFFKESKLGPWIGKPIEQDYFKIQ